LIPHDQLLRHAFQNVFEPFNLDDDTPSFTEDNLLAVKIIEVFRHLLARGSYNTGKNFVTDI
jgi:phosphatidylserine/phosphatidylglycerophosphate/cardiolipin synthase-like enzyme